MRITLLFIFLSFSICASGQFVREKNIIVPQKDTDYGYRVATAGKDGMVLFKEAYNIENRLKRKWDILLLDKELNLKGKSAFESELNFVISSVKPYSDYIYLMFQDTNVPIEKVFFLIFKIDEEQYQVFEIGGLLPREIFGFEVLGNSLFLVGANQQRPAILKYNFGDPRPEVLKGLFDEKNEILHSSVNEELGYMQVITRMKQKGKETVLLIKKFDESGEMVKDLLISSPKGYHMINALATTDELGKTYVMGTYSFKKSKLSNGIFSTVFEEGQQNPLYYYDYPNLLNYFDYLQDPVEIERMKQRYAEGGESKSIKINHIPRRLDIYGDELIYLGEVFELAGSEPTKYGFLWQQEYTKYSHAIALGIDRNGKIKWDNTLSLSGQSSLASQQQTHIGKIDDNQIFFYTDGIGIHYKVFQGNREVINKDFFVIDGYSMEQVGGQIMKSGKIARWYDDIFVSYGESSWYDNNNKLHRSFYLNKIQLGPTLSQ